MTTIPERITSEALLQEAASPEEMMNKCVDREQLLISDRCTDLVGSDQKWRW